MDVDYSGHFGVGVKIIEPEDFPSDVDSMDEYMEVIEEVVNVDVEWFSVGDQYSSGRQDDYYLCIAEPFMFGEFKLEKAAAFISALKENEIEFEGNLDIVGGLSIW